MTNALHLTASKRQEAVKDLKDFLPAVIYGSGIEATSLTIKRNDFERIFAEAGESGLVALKLDDGQELPVIIKDLQMDAIKNRIIHVDFYKVNMDKKVTAEVTLHFIGEAPAVKTHGAIVVEHLDQLHIECLPANLIQKIDVDLSALAEISDAIHVSDIVLPFGITTKNDPTEIVVNAVEPKKVVEEVVVKPEETAEGEEGAETTAAETTEGEDKAEEKKEGEKK